MEVKPSQRRRARRLLLQAMYQWLISQNALTDIEAQFHVDNNMSKVDQEYFHELLHGIPEHLTELDRLISPFSNIPIADLDPIELCVLRIAAYELRYRIDIPYKVVIDEALSLTKAFGNIDGYKFVNGVLDKLAHEERRVEIGG